MTRERIRQIESRALKRLYTTINPLLNGNRKALLTESIDQLQLKNKLKKGLKKIGINTIEDFESIGEDDLIAMQGVGKASIEEAKIIYKTIFDKEMQDSESKD